MMVGIAFGVMNLAPQIGNRFAGGVDEFWVVDRPVRDGEDVVHLVYSVMNGRIFSRSEGPTPLTWLSSLMLLNPPIPSR